MFSKFSLNYLSFCSSRRIATNTSPIFHIRENVKQIKPSATLKINELMNQRLSQGHKVFRFGFGQSPFPIPKVAVDSLKNNAFRNEYMAVRGYQPLRESIIQFEKNQKNPIPDEICSEDVLIGPGSKELLYLIQYAFQGNLILHAPYWVSYYPQGQLSESPITIIQSTYENGYQIDPDVLESEIKKIGSNKPKLILINSPNNPTSLDTEPTLLKDIADVARRHQCLILSDEIYGRLHYQDNHYSISSFYPEGTIITSGLSKWAGAGGWRLGYAIFPPNLRELLNAVSKIARYFSFFSSHSYSNSYTTVASPIQMAAYDILNFHQDEIEQYLIKSRRIVTTLADYAYNTLSSCGVKMIKPNSAFYLYPDFGECPRYQQWIKDGINTSQLMVQELVDKTGIMCLAGSDFGAPPHQMTVRLTLTDYDGKKCLDNVFSENATELEKNNFMRKYCPNMIEGLKLLKEYLNS